MDTTTQMETSYVNVKKLRGLDNQQLSAFRINVNRDTMVKVQRLASNGVGSSEPKCRGKRMVFKATPIQERWKAVPNGCHEFVGHIMPNGYGQARYQGKTQYAHRVMWQVSFGPIGENYVLHKCDNRKCINPEHLFLGSFDENMHDMVVKERQAHGMRNGHAKLTDDQVREIRVIKCRQKDAAAKFGVSASLISQIRKRRIWKYV